MKTTTKLCAVLLACATLNANASLISVQTGQRSTGSQTSAEGYRNVVESDLKNTGSGYGSAALDAYDNVRSSWSLGSYHDFAWKSTIDFGVTAAQAGNWDFRAGVDFDYGGALFIDGKAVDFKSNNMWWAGSYANASQILQASLDLSAGNHTLTIYGIEGCCDGAVQTQYKYGNQQFASFAKADGLDRVSDVPEPATLASLTLGLGLIAGLRRRRNKRD